MILCVSPGLCLLKGWGGEMEWRNPQDHIAFEGHMDFLSLIRSWSSFPGTRETLHNTPQGFLKHGNCQNNHHVALLVRDHETGSGQWWLLWQFQSYVEIVVGIPTPLGACCKFWGVKESPYTPWIQQWFWGSCWFFPSPAATTTITWLSYSGTV